MPPPRYRFAEFTLSPARRALFRSGREVPLIPRYLDLLLLLVEKRSVALHRQEIFDRVWADVVVSDGALSQAVRTLRRTLGEDGERVFVRTVSRHGYQFVCPVAEETDDGEAPVPEAGVPAPARGATDPLAKALARLVDPGAEDDARREAAEELHSLGTAEALRRLDRAPGHARAWAHLRDSRWDVAGAGIVPLLAPPAGPRGLGRPRRPASAPCPPPRRIALGLSVRRRSRGGRARRLARRPCDGGARRERRAFAPRRARPRGRGVAGVGAAGVGCGLAAAEALVRSWRTLALAVLGAAGGALVGAVAHRVAVGLLEALFGLDGLATGGGLEGLVLGAAAGLGFGITTRRISGGLAAPRGRARAGTVAATALACALAAAGVSAAGGRLGATSLDAIVGRFAASRVELARLGRPFGEEGLGPRARTALGFGEGLLFGAGLAVGLTRRPRRRSDG